MPSAKIGYLLQAVRKHKERKATIPEEDVIHVSEPAAMAATAYETVRNAMEYDEEHLLRRNAVRRIVKRRLGEDDAHSLASSILRELIWARYLPNDKIPEWTIDEVAKVLKKYQPLFERLEMERATRTDMYDWLLDLLSTEIEYVIEPPRIDEALASFAYEELGKRMVWESNLVTAEDRDTLLYLAVHRAVLKSNIATLRFRMMTLFYPQWLTADAQDPVVAEVTNHLEAVVHAIEEHVSHPASDDLYRLVRRHAVVFYVLRDIAEDNPDAFERAVQRQERDRLANAVTKAAAVRYKRFRTRLTRSVLRAVLFLFLTKTILAFLIELPFERLILKEEKWTPLVVNIVFHPLLLGAIGLTVRIPEKDNTKKIVAEMEALFGWEEDFVLKYKKRKAWATGKIALIFRVLYAGAFLSTVGAIVWVLASFGFNAISIFFFLFFLSLVMFFGLKIRNTRRELVIISRKRNIVGPLLDVLFLPMIRAGRWMALRAPRINIFLFFLDFIIEAPFKAAIRLIEGWLAFLREKKEEI